MSETPYAMAAEEIGSLMDGYLAGDMAAAALLEEALLDNKALIVQALRIASVARSGLTEWQPIETAPKDGTSILLFEPPELGRFVGYWNTPRQAFAAVLSVKERQPTHWMPLPHPPRDEQSSNS